MRILVLGDSLPLPRPRQGQPMAKTWPSLLRERMPQCEICLRAHTRHTINEVIKELGFFTDSLTDFDALIVQTGIVDCAPRPYPHLVAKILDACVSMGTYRKIEAFTHRRLLWLYRRPWVSTRRFAQGIEQVVQTASANNPQLVICFVAIAPATRSIVATLPGIDRSALRYNEALRSAVETLSIRYKCHYLDPFVNTDPLDVTIQDGHHLSCLGHKLVAASVASALEKSALLDSRVS